MGGGFDGFPLKPSRYNNEPSLWDLETHEGMNERTYLSHELKMGNGSIVTFTTPWRGDGPLARGTGCGPPPDIC